MPEDCDPIEFFPPSDVFGGTKPVPSCLPGEAREPNELREPTGAVQQPSPSQRPGVITVGNMEVTLSCTDNSIGRDVTVGAGVLTAVVAFAESPNIPDDVLDYIAVNNLVAWIDERIKNETFTSEELAQQTGMALEHAAVLMDAIREMQRSLTAGAESMARAQLECYWNNTSQTATCEDEAMAHPADHPAAVYTITVPAGHLQSYVSQADADAKALAMAESMLNCFYVSDQFIATCESRPAALSQEPVPNDSVPVYEGLPLRVGSVTVLTGQFTSVYSKEDANTQAQDFAFAQLICFYVNDPYYLECEDPNARPQGVDPTTSDPQNADPAASRKGQRVTLPRGYIVSDISTEEANAQAVILAESLLECCFINRTVRVECPPYELVNPDGTPVLDAFGNPILIPASQISSPVWSVEIPAGEYTSCESQEMADSLAVTATEGVLDCYYCNKIVLPACVPDWVLMAVTDGILLPDGTIYTLPLPLDTSKGITNPYTGEPEDLTMWSIDATIGMNADAFCSPEYPQSQQIAESAGTEKVDVLADTRGECQFANDLVIAACSTADPYDPLNTSTDHLGTTPSGEPYRFYSKFPVGECLDMSATAPEPGAYVEVPAETIVITALDTPGTLPDTDPGYHRDTNDRLTKEYANQLAFDMATSLLYCVFSNPPTSGVCELVSSPLPYEELCTDTWLIGGEKPASMLSPESNTADNPVTVGAGMFTSFESMTEVYTATSRFVLSLLFCEYCNEYQEAECPPDKMQLNAAKVQQCTFRAATLAEANALASEMASSMLACIDPVDIESGEQGPPGEPGLDGQDGECTGGECSGQCYGVYS